MKLLRPASHRALPPRRSALRDGTRPGSALVEMALLLPLLVTLTFGSIEAANAIHLKQVLTTTAYESARVASSAAKTEAQARTRAQQVLTAYRIQGYTINISPNINANTAAGTEVTVTVSASFNQNFPSFLPFFRSRVPAATVRMIRL